MRVLELKALLNRDDRHDDQTIKIVMHSPSVLGGYDYGKS